MEIEADGASDIGKVREGNEDAFCVAPDLGLFAVADGMGGHEAGEVASHLALEALHGVVAAAPEGADITQVLRQGMDAASQAVSREANAQTTKRKMGTTLTAMLVRGDRAAVAHIGDSRLYRVRWGEVEKLTEDHTAAQELVKAGAIPPEAAEDHAWSNILSRVIGHDPNVEAEVMELALEPGDRFLLCSDGFGKALRDPRWLTWLSKQKSVEQTASRLVSRAVELDGQDNATAVVVAVGPEDARRERRSAWRSLRSSIESALDREE